MRIALSNEAVVNTQLPGNQEDECQPEAYTEREHAETAVAWGVRESSHGRWHESWVTKSKETAVDQSTVQSMGWGVIKPHLSSMFPKHGW